MCTKVETCVARLSQNAPSGTVCVSKFVSVVESFLLTNKFSSVIQINIQPTQVASFSSGATLCDSLTIYVSSFLQHKHWNVAAVSVGP